MSTLVGHFVLSPRESEKRDSKGDEREGHDRKSNRNESEETEEIKKNSPSILTCYSYPLQIKLLKCKPISVGHAGDVRYTSPSPHHTIPNKYFCVAIQYKRVGLVWSLMAQSILLSSYQASQFT